MRCPSLSGVSAVICVASVCECVCGGGSVCWWARPTAALGRQPAERIRAVQPRPSSSPSRTCDGPRAPAAPGNAPRWPARRAPPGSPPHAAGRLPGPAGSTAGHGPGTPAGRWGRPLRVGRAGLPARPRRPSPLPAPAQAAAPLASSRARQGRCARAAACVVRPAHMRLASGAPTGTHPREDVDDVLAKPALAHAAAEVKVVRLDLWGGTGASGRRSASCTQVRGRHARSYGRLRPAGGPQQPSLHAVRMQLPVCSRGSAA